MTSQAGLRRDSNGGPIRRLVQELRGRNCAHLVVAVSALLFAFFPGPGCAADVSDLQERSVLIQLFGPWKFHVGDDRRFADPEFADSDWQTLSLRPEEGAHDGDVGLSGYVAGWSSQGHAGYVGVAWYRIEIDLTGMNTRQLAFLGPPMVDGNYAIFVNGHLAGASADIDSDVPRARSVRPKLFAIEPDWLTLGPRLVVAIRVWTPALAMDDSGESGGIHIAPALGTRDTLNYLYRYQWQQTVLGFVVDAIEPACLVALLCAAILIGLRRAWTPALAWLSTALLATALLRANNAIYAWWDFESLEVYEFLRTTVLGPLALVAWAVTWWNAGRPKWGKAALGLLGIFAVAGGFVVYLRESATADHWLLGIIATLGTLARLGLGATILVSIALAALRSTRRADRMIAGALVLVVLFAEELSALGIPGIWFPWGIGVSRTQFALAALICALSAMLLREADARGSIAS